MSGTETAGLTGPKQLGGQRPVEWPNAGKDNPFSHSVFLLFTSKERGPHVL